MFIRWFKRLLLGGYYDDRPADILFLGFAKIITDTEFLKKLQIEDGFDNRLSCLAAFMFCWQDYLYKNKQEKLRQDFMDLTVKLLDDSLRADGVSDIRIGKKVKERLQNFYAQLVTYDVLFNESEGKPSKTKVQETIEHYLQTNDKGKAMADYLLAFRDRLQKIKPDDLMQDGLLPKLFKV